MPEGHPEVSVASLDVSQRSPDVLKAKTLCHCARWLKHPQDCTHGSVYLLVMMIFDCFTLSCDGLLAVFVTIYCFKVYIIVYFIVLVDWVS